jgi:hypothetical protein
MGYVNSLLRRSRRTPTAQRVVVDAAAAAPHTKRPLHIATSVLIIAKHRHTAVSVSDARDAIQRLAAATWPTTEDKRVIEDLAGATGLPLSELAEVTKEWLPW